MENYSVFIVTLKEILSNWKPWKLALTLIALVIAWRLPDVLHELRQW